MGRCLQIGSGPAVTMQAFAVMKWLVELDLTGFRNRTQVLNVNMGESTPFILQTAEHRVVGVAGVAGTVARHAVVLEMRGSQITPVINVKTAAVVLHGVTR